MLTAPRAPRPAPRAQMPAVPSGGANLPCDANPIKPKPLRLSFMPQPDPEPPSPTVGRFSIIDTSRGSTTMFASFFNTSAVDEFADSIVAEVKRFLPPAFAPGTKNIEGRAEKLNERIAQRTLEFMKTIPRLNIYKKAHLAARVREGMSANGYPEPFVKSFSYDLIARLQAASKSRNR